MDLHRKGDTFCREYAAATSIGGRQFHAASACSLQESVVFTKHSRTL